MPDSDTVLHVSLGESRYDRQERVGWWDQGRLARARVLVVGAGALGNEIVKNLVLTGVGDIVVVDMDVIESSNLARCVFFRPEDEGRPKAETLAERASELNPDSKITGIVGDIRSFGTGIALRADVIVGGLDNREARLYCNRLAARTRRTWVDGAIEALSGVARVFSPPGSCYECTLSDVDWSALAHRQSCRLLSREDLLAGKVPTTAPTSSIVAGIEAQETIKLLHRDLEGVNVLNGAIVFNGAANDCYSITYPTQDDCLAHHHSDDPIGLDAQPDGGGGLTFRSLAELCWPDIELNASDSPLVVDLADNHVIGWNCAACEDSALDGRPASLVSWGDSICPRCGESRVPHIATSVEVPGPLEHMTLQSLGVREDEILPIRAGIEERFAWMARHDRRLPASWANGSHDRRPSSHPGPGDTGHA
jgi:molybdopterin/thiamine biosynthesis adenylyltransferase